MVFPFSFHFCPHVYSCTTSQILSVPNRFLLNKILHGTSVIVPTVTWGKWALVSVSFTLLDNPAVVFCRPLCGCCSQATASLSLSLSTQTLSPPFLSPCPNLFHTAHRVLHTTCNMLYITSLLASQSSHSFSCPALWLFHFEFGKNVEEVVSSMFSLYAVS